MSFFLFYLGNIGVEQLHMTYYAWLLKELWVAWGFFLLLVVVGLYLAYIKGVLLAQWTGDVYFLT